MTRFEGTVIPQPAFADDDGRADEALATALAASPRDRYEVLAALLGTRLLVPVVAVLDSVESLEGQHGSARQVEKDSHMASVTLTRADGRHGLLCFTSVEHVTAWRTDARPVAVHAEQAAATARDAGQSLIIDLDRAEPFVVDGDELAALADGVAVVAPWLREDVRVALLDALGDGIAAGVIRVKMEPWPTASLAVQVRVEPGVRLDADAVATRVRESMAGLPALEAGVAIVIDGDLI